MPIEASKGRLVHLTPPAVSIDKQPINLPPHWAADVRSSQDMSTLTSAPQAGALQAPVAQPEDEHLSPPSPTTGAAGLAPDRAAQLFRAYDLMGRGWLSRTQMVAALSELSVVHGLGEKGLNQVLAQDPATSREARYSLQDFLSMYERIGLYQAKSARGERIKALSAISDPPPGAANSAALQAAFSAYCRYAAGTSRLLMAQAEQGLGTEQRMNAQQLMRLCQDLDLLSSGPSDSPHAPVTFSTVDVIFAKCKTPGTGRRLSYGQWLRALAALSDATGQDLFSIITRHALRLNPHLADAATPATQDDKADKGMRGGPGAGREQVGSSLGSGLPRLRPAATEHAAVRLSTGGSMQVMSPPRSSAGPRIQPPPANLPGRLVVLERALLEEEAKLHSAAQHSEAPVPTGSPLQARKNAPATRPGSQPATRAVSAQPKHHVAQAWAAEQPPAQPPDAKQDGDCTQSDLPQPAAGGASPTGSRATTPKRPRSTGSPLRATRLARISMVDTAGIATEVWKFSPARPEAWDEIPPWMATILQRVQHLEAVEQERQAAEQVAQADIIFRTQRWEQSERLLMGKSTTLESRFIALERRCADSDALVGNLIKQIEETRAMNEQMAALQQQVSEAAGWRDAMAAERQLMQDELSRLREQLGGSTGGWQAAVARTRQDLASQVAEVQEAVGSAAAGLDAAAVEAVVDARVTSLAEHLVALTAEKAVEATAPLQATVAEIQGHLGSVSARVDTLSSELAQQQETAAALSATAEEAKVLAEQQVAASGSGADTAAVESVQRELDSLQSEVESLKTAVAIAQGVTEQLKVQHTTTSTALDSTKDMVQQLHGKLEKHMDDVGEKFAEINTAHLTMPPAAAGEASDAAGAKLVSLEAKLGAQAKEVSTQLAELSVRLEAAEQLRTKVEELATKQAATSEEVAKLGSSGGKDASAPAPMDASGASPEGLQQLEAKLVSQIDDLATKLTDLSAAFEQSRESHAGEQGLGPRVSDLEESVGSFASVLKGISEASQADSADVRQKLKELTEQLEQTASAAEAAAKASTSAAPPATATSENLSLLEKRCADVEQLSKDLSEKVAALSQSDILKRLDAAEARLQEAVAAGPPASTRPTSAAPREDQDLEVMRGQLRVVQSQVGQVAGQLAEVQASVGRADAAAAAATAQAAAAQAAAAEAVQLATTASSAGVSQQTLDTRLAALSQEMSAKLASVPSSDKVALLEAGLAQSAAKLTELDAGMQALAAAALDSQRKEPQPDAQLTERVGRIESKVMELGNKPYEHMNSGRLLADETFHRASDGDVSHRGASRDGAGGNASKRDMETLKLKVTQMTTLTENLKDRVGRLEAGGGGGAGAAGAPTPAGPQAAAAMQMAQMQVMQQMAMMQNTIQQLNGKISTLETKSSMGSGQGAAQEAMQQATAQQVNLIQGAIVQLNGELNSLKLAVPQLVSTIKNNAGGLDAASITAAVARGEHGPLLGALAEEIQRNQVRVGNMESDMRISMTTLAKAADLSQLELTVVSRTEKLEEAVEELRRGGGVTSGGGAAINNRLSSAMPGTAAAGGAPAGDSTPTNTHRFATWDALKHAENTLTRTQQQNKEEIVRLLNQLSDINHKISATEQQLIQRMDVKEKVLMRMAKEVDDMKTQLTDLASKANSPPPAAATGGRGASTTRAKSSRYNMFDD